MSLLSLAGFLFPLYLILSNISLKNKLIFFYIPVYIYLALLSFVLSVPLFLLFSLLLTYALTLCLHDIKFRYIRYHQAAILLLLIIPILVLTFAGWYNLILSCLIGVLIMVPVWMITRGQGLGLADVLIFIELSALFRPQIVPLFLILSCLTAIPYAIYNRNKGIKQNGIPFIPFIITGAFIIYPLQFTILLRF